MIQAELYLALVSDPDVAELIGTRVYPMRMPQGGSLPAVVYQIVGGTPTTSLDGDSGLDGIRMQIKCWAKTYAGADDLSVVVRSAINNSNISSIPLMPPMDEEDKETKCFAKTGDYRMWSDVSSSASRTLSRFERVTFEGDDVITEVDLPSAIAANGFYLVTKNGRIVQETEEYAINAGRNKITFTEALAGGDFKDEGIIIYQKEVSPQFGRTEFEGDDVTTDIDLSSAIVDDGFYCVILNGRIAKEGASETYTINEDRDKIIFNSPPAGGDFKDEGVIIYQTT